MKPLDFLAGVLPSPGHGLYCVAELSSQKKEHVFVEALADAKADIKRWLSAERDIYFALATFDPAVRELKRRRRVAENAQYVKALFIDMDGYASKKEAVTALGAFLESTGLDTFGTPHVVGSGGGVHCYWPLTVEADITTWKPVAENFKRLCKQEGLAIDHTVTADAARVLRIPGTMNFKKKYDTPRPVKLLIEGDALVDIRRFGAMVRGLLSEANAPASNNFEATSVMPGGVRPSKRETTRSAAAEALIGNAATRFEPIWLKTEKGVGCGQLQFYIDNAQQDGMEPLWRGLLSWTKVCDDGQEFSEKLTELHPYPLSRMQTKLAEIKGPYPCAKMDSENPGVCPKCPYWGKVTNALALGREVKTDNRTREFEIPVAAFAERGADKEPLDMEEVLDEEEAEDQIIAKTRKAQRFPPPKGFDYGENGGIYCTIKETDATGVEVKAQVQVLPHDLFVMDMLKTADNDHQVHLLAIKHVGAADGPKKTEYQSVIVPTKTAVSKDELLKTLAGHNIYAARGAAMDTHLYQYVRGSIQEASLLRSAVTVPLQYGWQKDGSFVYNSRVFYPDGTEIAVPMPGLENLNRVTNARGTLEAWRKPWELLIKREMFTMLAMCLDSFASTLMQFSDYEGFVWHIGSTESGTGKSLTLSMKAGVWGHPVRYRTGKSTSPVAMQQRAGLLNSLPLLIDEITGKARGDFEWVPNLIFDLSEGQGKERMESGSNKERINNSTWATTCTLTSNTHLADILTGGRKHASYGELMRMLEWNPTEELRFDDSERAILQSIRKNFGVAGEAWVRWTVKNTAVCRDIRTKVHTRLRKEMRFMDEERYWHTGCANIIAAAILLGPNYANILTVPINQIIIALRALVDNARLTHQRAAKNAEDILNAYTREHYGKFVIVRRDEVGKVLSELGMDVASKSSTRYQVMGRIEHGTLRPEFVEYYIEEQLLKAHCAAMSFGYADFKRQILSMRKNGYLVKFGMKKDLLSKMDGPTLRVNVMHLSVPKERLDTDERDLPVVKD